MIGPRSLEELEELVSCISAISHCLGEYNGEHINDGITRLANAIEAQTKAQRKIGADICSSISGIANRIEDSFTGTDGIIGVLSEIRNALKGVAR